ncbi:hypothetical protein ACJRO7_020720 [Eucalyptus globulus]|uniref:Uncharacterized protein n=1 Tax=Eucalyptus globulus TaxID=34317 RepID=A0ABD3KJ10_EUCGL
MLRRAIGDKIFSLNVDEVTHQVYEGPYIHKYWVDKELNRNCLMVLASTLSIICSDRSEYWTWAEEEESCYPSNVNLHVARLNYVCWLDIKGKCKTSVLSQRTMYDVAIVVKMSSQNYGWEMPVNLSLEFPDGNRQVRTERLDNSEKERWIPISIGKFEMTPKTIGEMSFSLTQTGNYWKSGLSVKGVIFTPTAENEQPK